MGTDMGTGSYVDMGTGKDSYVGMGTGTGSYVGMGTGSYEGTRRVAFD